MQPNEESKPNIEPDEEDQSTMQSDQRDQPTKHSDEVNQEDQPPSKAREYDDLFSYVQSFGRYQKIVLFCSCFLVLLTSTQFGALLFVYGTPSFKCADANSTCLPSKCCNNCTSYVFDGSFRSVVSEFGLICDKAYIGATVQACFYGGMLAGSISGGVLADFIGRRKTIFSVVFILVLASVCAVFADCVSLLGILRFFVGFGAGGLQSAHYTLMIEITGPKRRSFAGVVYQVYFTGGFLVCNLFAYFVRDWRPLILMTGLPGLILYLFVRVFPESPRWLLSKNRLDEAEEVLVKCGKSSLDRKRLRTAIQEVSVAQFSQEKLSKDKIYTPLDLVRTPKLRRRSLFLAFNWFAVSFVGNSFFLYIGNLAGSIYINFFVVNAICPIGAFLCGLLLKRIGHRLAHAVVLLVVGILSLVSLIVPDDQPMVRTWMFVAAFGISNGMWVTIFLLGSELFPTVLRSTAVGTGYTVGRIGAILAPYVGILGQLPGLSITLPLAIFGGVAIANCVSTLWLPETSYSKMHQTIEEEENAPEYYSFPCLRKGKKPDHNIIGDNDAITTNNAVVDTAM